MKTPWPALPVMQRGPRQILLFLVFAALFLAPVMAQGQVFSMRVPEVRVSSDVTSIELRPSRETTLRYYVTNLENESVDVTVAFVTGEVTFGPGGGVLVRRDSETAARVASAPEPSSMTIAANETRAVDVRVIGLSAANNTTLMGILQVLGPGGLPIADHRLPMTLRGTSVAAPTAPESGLARALRENAVAVALAGAGLVAFGVSRLFLRREAWRYAGVAAVLPLYTRLAKSQILDHEKRERIYMYVSERPGVNYSTIKEDLALPSGVLVHHLRMLEKNGLVRSMREGNLRRFAAAHSSMPPIPPRPLTPAQSRVLHVLLDEPMSQRGLAERLGISRQGAMQHVRELERRGFVEERDAGGERRWHATQRFQSR